MSEALLTELAALGIPEAALELRFVRSSGPGGQNVNKVSTAVQLSCDLKLCGLSPLVMSRLRTLAGRRLSSDQVIQINAQRLRTQDGNRRDALERLLELITEARIIPKLRRPTKPTKASKRKRIEGKVQRGQVKKLRTRVDGDD
jgi:ribosome-associated protein